MNKLIDHLPAGESARSEKEDRYCFFKELAKNFTSEGTLEALLNKTRTLKEIHRTLHSGWSCGHYELVRAVGYTLVNSTMSKPQRNKLIEALAARESFLLRMSSYKGLFEELFRYYDACEKEIRSLIPEKGPTVEPTDTLPEIKEE